MVETDKFVPLRLELIFHLSSLNVTMLKEALIFITVTIRSQAPFETGLTGNHGHRIGLTDASFPTNGFSDAPYLSATSTM